MELATFSLILLLGILPLAQSVAWNGNNWALACDFKGGDFTNAMVTQALKQQKWRVLSLTVKIRTS
jgi:hypothetical protein